MLYYTAHVILMYITVISYNFMIYHYILLWDSLYLTSSHQGLMSRIRGRKFFYWANLKTGINFKQIPQHSLPHTEKDFFLLLGFLRWKQRFFFLIFIFYYCGHHFPVFYSPSLSHTSLLGLNWKGRKWKMKFYLLVQGCSVIVWERRNKWRH